MNQPFLLLKSYIVRYISCHNGALAECLCGAVSRICVQINTERCGIKT